MYCIYTDKEVAEGDGNWDHVIPLSLGGKNQFCVWSETHTNSRLGSEVDGQIASDPLFSLALRNAGVKGQSGKPNLPRWKKATIDGRPTQVTWGLDEVTFWDAKSKTYRNPDEMAGKEITTELRIDEFAAVQFVAKCALGGAYFVYGDAIRSAIDCDELRVMMNSPFKVAASNPKILQSKMTACHRLHQDAVDPSGRAYVHRLLCEFTGRTTFIVTPHDEAVAFHVGVAGAYVGSITCEIRGTPLPIDAGDHDLGHVIMLSPGEMRRLSFRTFVGEFYHVATGSEPPKPPVPT